MDKKLLEAKRELYHLLLKKGDDVTDNEIEIMFYLSKDKQIQELLNKKINGSNSGTTRKN